MSRYRDSDLIAYILAFLVVAISGVAVGVASEATPAAADPVQSSGVAAAE